MNHSVIQQGKVYDSAESVKSIPSFIETYAIKTEELLEPNIKAYKTFNEFFYRLVRHSAVHPNGYFPFSFIPLTINATPQEA